MSSKHFCLKWTKFQTNILSAFESLQNTEDLADVTLTCEGINIKAHKFILSACSPYFRTIFKENPCAHPIVILKDVTYLDLIAIVNFMYHGEVLVAEEQLHSFLQTATILQVSGLINETPCAVNKTPPPKKVKVPSSESAEGHIKKIRTTPKSVKNTMNVDASQPIKHVALTAHLPTLEHNIKTESVETEENNEHNSLQSDEMVIERADTHLQSSLLEAALEVREKPSSILERSLTLQPASGRSPQSVALSGEKVNVVPIIPDISVPKTIFIPRKPPEGDLENLMLRSSSESSTSPSTFDRPSEFLQQSIKIEGEHSEMEVLTSDEMNLPFSRSVDIPHHSSQCGNCPHCGKIYSNQSALKYHVRLMHSDLTNMYCCHICPESFDYREGYKKHMTEVHSIRN